MHTSTRPSLSLSPPTSRKSPNSHVPPSTIIIMSVLSKMCVVTVGGGTIIEELIIDSTHHDKSLQHLQSGHSCGFPLLGGYSQLVSPRSHCSSGRQGEWLFVLGRKSRFLPQPTAGTLCSQAVCRQPGPRWYRTSRRKRNPRDCQSKSQPFPGSLQHRQQV